MKLFITCHMWSHKPFFFCFYSECFDCNTRQTIFRIIGPPKQGPLKYVSPKAYFRNFGGIRDYTHFSFVSKAKRLVDQHYDIEGEFLAKYCHS